MNAFFTVKRRRASGAGRDGLATTNFDTNLCATLLTKFGVEKYNMIRVASRRLYFAAHQQCILMRDEEFAVEWNRRPADPVH